MTSNISDPFPNTTNTNASRWVMLSLHGHGESAASARQWSYGLLPHDTPIHTIQANVNDHGVRSWFETGHYGVVPTDLARSVKRVRDQVTELRADGFEVLLSGFSQGGAVTMSAVYLGVEASAAMAFCSFFPEVDWSQVKSELGLGPNEPPEPERSKVPLLVLGRTEDPDVPAFFSEDAHNFLVSSGYHSSLKLLGGGHEVSEVVRSTAREWLGTVWKEQ